MCKVTVGVLLRIVAAAVLPHVIQPRQHMVAVLACLAAAGPHEHAIWRRKKKGKACHTTAHFLAASCRRGTAHIPGWTKSAAERTSESVALVAKDEGQIVRVATAPLRCRPVPKHLTCGASGKARQRFRAQLQKAVTAHGTGAHRTRTYPRTRARARTRASVYARGCSRSAGGAPCGSRVAGIFHDSHFPVWAGKKLVKNRVLRLYAPTLS